MKKRYVKLENYEKVLPKDQIEALHEIVVSFWSSEEGNMIGLFTDSESIYSSNDFYCSNLGVYYDLKEKHIMQSSVVRTNMFGYTYRLDIHIGKNPKAVITDCDDNSKLYIKAKDINKDKIEKGKEVNKSSLYKYLKSIRHTNIELGSFPLGGTEPVVRFINFIREIHPTILTDGREYKKSDFTLVDLDDGRYVYTLWEKRNKSYVYAIEIDIPGWIVKIRKNGIEYEMGRKELVD